MILLHQSDGSSEQIFYRYHRSMRYLYETVVKIGFKIIVAPYETFDKIETFEADSLLHRSTICKYRHIVLRKSIVLRSCISMNLIELIVSFIFLNIQPREN